MQRAAGALVMSRREPFGSKQEAKHKTQIWTLPLFFCDGQHWSIHTVRYSLHWMMDLTTNHVRQVAICGRQGQNPSGRLCSHF